MLAKIILHEGKQEIYCASEVWQWFAVTYRVLREIYKGRVQRNVLIWMALTCASRAELNKSSGVELFPHSWCVDPGKGVCVYSCVFLAVKQLFHIHFLRKVSVCTRVCVLSVVFHWNERDSDYVYMDINNLIIYLILNKTILWLRCLHESLLE